MELSKYLRIHAVAQEFTKRATSFDVNNMQLT